ncbi:facilitated trehalose transporter Tret1-like [Vanessa atalanta]|uniref:facilitated trehalose transporter Tret1-like n=1 Tax=Vanessa atalanta TaxID=42275 RepID=UPI001FCDED01|nr:facilitated trehalose transporter Tret1-like [Vanessa atalanta]
MNCVGDIYFWRQSLVLMADCTHSIGTGLMLSFPAVLNPSILSPSSTEISVTPDEASWIAASHGFSGVIGFCIIPPLMQIFGRKFAFFCMNILVSIGFFVFALANSISALYAARIIQGMSLCGVYITAIVLGEYSHPKRRGYFITLKKASVAIGSLMCHSMASYWTWRQIAIFAIIPQIISIILTCLWPESPAFLAMKGRYEECSASYVWLHGDTPKNRKDLEEIIAAQQDRRQKNKNTKKDKLVAFFKKLMQRDFLRSFVIVSVLTMIIDACGRYYMLAYIVEILIEITRDKSIAVYCTIGADVLTLVALSTSCFIIRCFKRRTILFTAGILSVFLMFLTSFLTFLESNYHIYIYFWLTPFIILLNVFIVNAGVVPVCFAIIGEILPLEHKGTGACTTGIVFTILYALVMKLTPLMMDKTGIVGTFGIYGICVIAGLVILYFILNETKDKTLQEIENEIKGNKSSVFLKDKPLMS